MYKHLNKSLHEAYDILEDDMDEFEPEEVEEFTTDSSIEQRITTLENEVEELKDKDFINTDKSLIGDVDEPSFEDKVYKCFIDISKFPKDEIITEEVLNKRPYCDTFIPKTAGKIRTSSDNVKNILIDRFNK